MKKTLTAAQVKKLPVGTNVYLIKDGDDKFGFLWIVKSGRKKMLRGVQGNLLEIKDVDGFHYEVEQ